MTLEQQLIEERDQWTSEKIMDALHEEHAPGSVFTINDALIAYHKVYGVVMLRSTMNNHLGRLTTKGQLQRIEKGVYAHA